MPIFQDSNGLAVKFFIQKDLEEELQADLCETIASLGGRVESKVPRQGYILVQPGTAEEERLRLCWTSPDRPDRHFVPYTYVDACKIAGMLLRQIFVRDGEPIKMHIHSSIANLNARAHLSQRIMHSGGDPTASVQSAQVILADPTTDIFNHLVKIYQGVPDKYIESYLWVKKCAERGSVMYTPLVYKNPGGRRPGEERTQFTDEDEEHLCDWIAAKIPYKETGGRTGNRLYQQLCDLANDPEYAWVSRHTWQSWRERYKKNASRLDSMIAAIVQQKKPVQGEKGQYGYVRKAEEKPKKTRRKRGRNSNNNAEQNNGHNEEYVDSGDYSHSQAGPSLRVQMYLPGPVPVPVPVPQPLGLPAPGGGPLDTNSSPPRESPKEEEMDDANDGSEWVVRVGNADPPAWSKRKATEEVSEDGSQKRQRTGDYGSRILSQNSTDSHLNVGLSRLHIIDQSLRDIAKEFRFTVEEVQEYYDRCGEMGRTRTRFQKMRQELSARFRDEDGSK